MLNYTLRWLLFFTTVTKWLAKTQCKVPLTLLNRVQSAGDQVVYMILHCTPKLWHSISRNHWLMPHPDAKCILFSLNAALLQYYVSTWFRILKSLSPNATSYLWAPVTFFWDKENLSYIFPGYKSAEEPFPPSKKRMAIQKIKIR